MPANCEMEMEQLRENLVESQAVVSAQINSPKKEK